jgi:hypothetical protein
MAILLVLLMEESTEVSCSLVALYSNQVLCESIHQFGYWGDRQVGTLTYYHKLMLLMKEGR